MENIEIAYLVHACIEHDNLAIVDEIVNKMKESPLAGNIVEDYQKEIRSAIEKHDLGTLSHIAKGVRAEIKDEIISR